VPQGARPSNAARCAKKRVQSDRGLPASTVPPRRSAALPASGSVTEAAEFFTPSGGRASLDFPGGVSASRMAEVLSAVGFLYKKPGDRLTYPG
jgi:hypothetical protein